MKSCNCVAEKEIAIKEKFGESACLNSDLITGRIYLTIYYDETGRGGKVKQKETLLGLSRCPWCQKPYDKN